MHLRRDRGGEGMNLTEIDEKKYQKDIRIEASTEVVELINYKQRRVFSNILYRNMNEWERGYRYALDELETDVIVLKGVNRNDI